MALSSPLPPELRATLPPELRGLRRDHVRLLVLDRATGNIQHTRFDRIGERLNPGDLLVVNTSRTLPAAVPARRAGGELVQLRPAVRRDGAWDAIAVEPTPPHGNVDLRPGEELIIGHGLRARVAGRREDIPLLWQLQVSHDGTDEILSEGEPIRYSYISRPVSLDYYQTVYADRPGSAEMPSAGRPFSWELLRELGTRGVDIAPLTLHTGLSSYQDDAFDAEHHLHEEWFEVPKETAAAINRARRVIAVGTTVVRALAGATVQGRVVATSGWTSARIGRDSDVAPITGLVTGLHEPDTSHFELMRALVPEALLLRAYEDAVSRRYLWHEFGDAMLIL